MKRSRPSGAWRRLLSSPSSATSWLPYNWNWQRRWREAESFLEEHPIVLMDVGARGEGPAELTSLHRHVTRVGFEPDPDECRRLTAAGEGTFYPALVAGTAGTSTLHLYRSAEYSSVLRLSERYQRLWLGEMPEEATVECPAITIDDFLTQRPDLVPDLLKVDTQGTELDVLRGAERSLGQIAMVEVEVEFISMYEGQALFGDICAYLFERGFELLYLNRTFRARRELYQGPTRGQLVDADALFGRREDRLQGLTTEQVIKYVILLCQYGHLDIAWQIVSENVAVLGAGPDLSGIFRKPSHRLWRGALMQLDKLLAVGLHLRRYNQRGMDNDRAWPVR